MKRIILFSQPLPEVLEKLVPQIFDVNLPNKVIGYLNPDGLITESGEKYFNNWKKIAEENNAKLVHIDISKPVYENVFNAINILLITGGNACKLLANIRKNNYEKAIKDFIARENTIFAGFSAGAMILTPSIQLAAIEPFLENEEEKLSDFSALGVLNFELFPHFEEEYEEILKKYMNKTSNKVVTLGNSEYLVINI